MVKKSGGYHVDIYIVCNEFGSLFEWYTFAGGIFGCSDKLFNMIIE